MIKQFAVRVETAVYEVEFVTLGFEGLDETACWISINCVKCPELDGWTEEPHFDNTVSD
ncbi:hypothetical protein AN8747.2 [Aspergillus nidulans FGSC A4]|nr:hypothetical protein AN8747.2 [Aspergillus nidulans FGSC A4]|eukprot:XP_682016.1 hypothetical protein AN8747.2 [Aspergillus nidulans FGSC A4]